MPSPSLPPSSAPSSMPPLPRLNLIVATTPTLGIGHAGTLPWPPLKADLRFFARVTKRPPPVPSVPLCDPSSLANGREAPAAGGKERKVMNAVIMGRKTWDSLPEAVRPLGGRINVVLSRSAPDVAATNPSAGLRSGDSGRSGVEGGGTKSTDTAKAPISKPARPPVLHASTLTQALHLLQSHFPPVEREEETKSATTSLQHQTEQRSITLGRVFVIGGAQIYTLALAAKTPDGGPLVDRILWTQLKGEWPSDVWFPSGVLPLNGGAQSGVTNSEDRWAVRSQEEMEKWVGESGVGGLKREGEVEFEVVMVERKGVA